MYIYIYTHTLDDMNPRESYPSLYIFYGNITHVEITQYLILQFTSRYSDHFFY